MIDPIKHELAFPVKEVNNGGFTIKNHPGMTLRDYFAAKAMHAMLSTYPRPDTAQAEDTPDNRFLSEDAYGIADAMMEAREQVSD